MTSMLKIIQKRAYTFLNTTWGFISFLVLNYWLITSVIQSFQSRDPCSLRGGSCSKINFHDNIGNVASEVYRAYGPIDVVYTWVNGSDPIWLRKKNHWAAKYSPHIEHNITSNSTTGSGGGNVTEDEIMSDNRYRDSEELRYSLRSLVKYAPWIRHIYLVTDNQLPYWLNLETPHLTVIPHERIFPNTSHLPVFSSPAIESHLHRIPGLSEYFVYFNDDVFLGAPVLPEDFISIGGVQKLVMAWEVPKCAPGCSDTWIGDGYCDKACNVSECNFDYPDCVNGSNVLGSGGYGGSAGYNSAPVVQCAKGCPDSWLADKICDQRCNNYECAYDLGDCGLGLVVDSFPSMVLTKSTAMVSSDPVSFGLGLDSNEHGLGHGEHGDLQGSGFYYGDYHAFDYNDTMPPMARKMKEGAFAVAYGTRAVSIDLSYLADLANVSSINRTEIKWTKADHDDAMVVHTVALLIKHQRLVVLLHTDNEHYPIDLPHQVAFNVHLTDSNAEHLCASFVLHVTARDDTDYLHACLPPGMSALNTSWVQGSSNGQEMNVDVLPMPYRTEEADGVVLGVVLSVALPLTANASCAGHQVILHTSTNASNASSTLPLCAMLMGYGNHQFHFLSGADALAQSQEAYQTFINSNAATVMLKHSIYTLRRVGQHRVLLGVPMIEGEFVHVHLQIVQAQGEGQGEEQKEVAFVSALVQWADNSASRVAAAAAVPEVVPEVTVEAPAVLDSTAVPVSDPAASPVAADLIADPAANPVFEHLPVAVQAILTADAIAESNPALENNPNINTPYITYMHNMPPIPANSTARRLTAQPLASVSAVRRLLGRMTARVLTWLSPAAVLPEHSQRSQHQHQQHSQHHHQQMQYVQQLFAAFHLDPPSHTYTHRRRLDTYAQSLIHVNRLYNKEFGNENRKVPAHVPHFISKTAMEEMQGFYPERWNKTSSNRFRSGDDMQYAFSYYYYVIHRYKKIKYNLLFYLQTFVDTDNDGLVSDNEMVTLANIFYQHSVSEADLTALHEQLNNCSSLVHNELMNASTAMGSVNKLLTVRFHPSVHEIAACEEVREVLYKNIHWNQVYSDPVLLADKDLVAFEMINDNYTSTVSLLDSIRSRQSKFICVNDNMHSPTDALIGKLKDFYLSFFPFKTIFEREHPNPTLYLDEYMVMKHAKQQASMLTKVTDQAQVKYESFQAHLQELLKPIKQTLGEWAYQLYLLLGEETDKDAYLHKLRSELHHNPKSTVKKSNPGLLVSENNVNYKSLQQEDDKGENSLHLGLLCGVLGLLLTVVLKKMVGAAAQGHQAAAEEAAAAVPAAAPKASNASGNAGNGGNGGAAGTGKKKK